MEKETFDTRGMIEESLHEADGQSSVEAARRIEERAQRLEAVQEKVRAMVGNVMDASMRQIAQTQGELEDAAADLRSLDIGVESLGSGVGGQAYVGQEGTAVVDMRKALREDGTFDMQFARGVEAHEHRHEEQASASRDILETDAMLAAKKKVPESINHVSSEYRAIFSRTLARYTEQQVEDIAMGRATEADVAMAA